MYNRQGQPTRNQPKVTPHPSDNDELTSDEIEIALSYLKKRFSDYSLDQVMLSITQHVEEKQQEMLQNHGLTDWQEDLPEERPTFREDRVIPRRTRITHNNQVQRELREKKFAISAKNEEKPNKFEQFIAQLFCKTEINFKLVQLYFKDITHSKYRYYLNKIHGQAFKEIQNFLRYQCGIQIQHLSTNQKQQLKTHLKKVKEWLSQKDVSQLQSYYKFLQRHYEKKSVEITYDEALKLYKTLLETIKSPYVNVMEAVDDGEKKQMRQPSRNIGQARVRQLKTMTKEEQKQVVQSYLLLKDIKAQGQFLCQQWGYSPKWSRENLNLVLYECLKKSLKRITRIKDKHLNKGTPFLFKESNQEVISLFESGQEDASRLREKVFQFYLDNEVTLTDLTDIIKQLNAFFSGNNGTREVYEIDSEDELPKVERSQNKREAEADIPSQSPEEARAIKTEINQNGRLQVKLTANMEKQKRTEATNEEAKQKVVSRSLAVKGRVTEVIEID